jgi:hypothetical protein
MIITHKQGDHRSSPYKLKIGKLSYIKSDYLFDLAAAYDLKSNDQLDWNKLTGISFYLLSSTKNSAMIGWRYNTESNRFEFCAYCHVSGKRIFTPPLFSVKPGWSFTAEIEVADGGVYFAFTDDMKSTNHFQKFEKQPKMRRLISAWFGGNNPAPKKITFTQNLTVR